MKLGVIGGGAMAEALVAGALKQNRYGASEILISEPSLTRRAYWEAQYGVQTTSDNQAVAGANLVLLAIKPQVLTEVAEGFVKTEGLLVSILAGISLAKLAQTFPGCRLVRAMPNTPALVSTGITALSIGVNEVMDVEVEHLFQAVGQVVKVPESQLDAVTGLSGSGPAYIALITEALIDGGVAAGLPRPLAQELVLATILGSIQMIQTEQLHPAQLKDRVTSPGGTTIAGLAQLENRAVRGALIDAVLAATARARALGN